MATSIQISASHALHICIHHAAHMHMDTTSKLTQCIHIHVHLVHTHKLTRTTGYAVEEYLCTYTHKCNRVHMHLRAHTYACGSQNEHTRCGVSECMDGGMTLRTVCEVKRCFYTHRVSVTVWLHMPVFMAACIRAFAHVYNPFVLRHAVADEHTCPCVTRVYVCTCA